MSNKCPMCNTAEDEHAEVLRVLKWFDDNRPAAEMATLVAPESELGAAYLRAADLYRKLKTQ